MPLFSMHGAPPPLPLFWATCTSFSAVKNKYIWCIFQFGQVVQLFLDVKNDVFARITEPSNDDYDNDVSDNCDNNFGTFDDFGVNNDQKVSNNMILMSKYKGKHGGKKGQKIRAWVDPPPHHSGNARKKTFFFIDVFP